MHPTAEPQIISIGTAVPSRRYSQQELAALFGLQNPRLLRLFNSSHIKYRHLILPEAGALGMPEESILELNEKHKQGCLDLGSQAIVRALAPYGLDVADVDLLVCVTTTGYLCPGVSAYLVKQMGFRENVARVDVVGMGCNAALNGMQPAWTYLQANPAGRAVLMCVEVCSAAYVHNSSIENAVVNSLFGDGAAAVLMASNGNGYPWPRVLGFESHIVVEAIETMRFNLDHGKLSFFLDRDIPYVIGANCDKPVSRLLERFSLKRRDIRHWIIHSGGKKVIDSIKMNLDLTDHDVRHTTYILENYGNISSCASLFSLHRLQQEGVTRPGDHGILMAMGPGAAIETALLRW